MTLKAALFDLDDTLLAFDAVTEISWRQVCQNYCEGKPRLKPESIYKAIRKMSDWFWSDEIRHRLGRQDLLSTRRKIVTTAFCEMGLPTTDATDVADCYSRIRLDNMYMLPGVTETLTYILKKGLKLALITNGDAETQRYKINRFNLAPYFEWIFIEGELGFGKPDRRVYELALTSFNIKPDETCMVGDNLTWDVITPQSLGIKGIWFDRKGQGLPFGAHKAPSRIIYDITELQQVIC